MPSRIEDYALIGDCETGALVSRSGSVDWLCWPRFDSAACFAALLGEPRHGRWKIAPADPAARITRRYEPGALILETTFETETGTVAVIDFMTPRGRASNLIRMVMGKIGRVDMDLELVLRFGYGATIPWVTPGEGAFLPCSFWLADAYVMLGRIEDARRLFERLLGLCNDVGLLSEEYDTVVGRQVGNFPQAFSHVGLLNTAQNLTRTAKPSLQRAGRPRGTS